MYHVMVHGVASRNHSGDTIHERMMLARRLFHTEVYAEHEYIERIGKVIESKTNWNGDIYVTLLLKSSHDLVHRGVITGEYRGLAICDGAVQITRAQTRGRGIRTITLVPTKD